MDAPSIFSSICRMQLSVKILKWRMYWQKHSNWHFVINWRMFSKMWYFGKNRMFPCVAWGDQITMRWMDWRMLRRHIFRTGGLWKNWNYNYNFNRNQLKSSQNWIFLLTVTDHDRPSLRRWPAYFNESKLISQLM